MSADAHGSDALAAELPATYELVRRQRVDSVSREALRLGRQGADEGTLVWAAEEDNSGPPGALYAAVLLRPGEEIGGRWPELAAVAAVAAGAAIAELCQPMTPLRYRWPDGLALGPDEAGRIALAPEAQLLAVAWRIHITAPPEGEPPVAALNTDGGADTTPGELLGRTSRFFLDWINRWAEEGFAPVRRAWLARRILEYLPPQAPAGEAVDIDPRGNLIVRTRDGDTSLPLADHLVTGSVPPR
ncbi:biotin/lipoate--protein ligase family protein [Arhodomonas sp. SL1]|uniref:biotin/lipoate--protein ligase family protein n=1 Tax=Arhodomonas sp. SL1 TaxID=3425691 RepID=UPI003F884532